MKNLVMKDRLEVGLAIDVHSVGEPYDGKDEYHKDDPTLMGTWKLHGFMDDHEYVDAETERWVWSIGRHRVTEKFFAAFDTRFYRHPDKDWECVFLR